MSDSAGCCAHLTVKYKTKPVGETGAVTGWWECNDCQSKFIPEAISHAECQARKSGTAGGNYPQDCDWPFCGCDPKANKVMEAIQESGYVLIKEPEPVAAPSDTGREQPPEKEKP